MDDLSNFQWFSQKVTLSRQDICRDVYKHHRRTIKIKREQTLVRNLMRIFDAALRISNERGFQAMTMRSLSRETGMSMGGLYAYFSGKEDLLEMLLRTGRITTKQILEEQVNQATDPESRLRSAIRAHLFLSEVMQPWFYFSYMEARRLGDVEKKKSMTAEIETEELFARIIEEGMNRGVFVVRDSLLTASVIKAMVQDWYVKRWKYAKREVSVDRYAGFVVECVESFCLPRFHSDTT